MSLLTIMQADSPTAIWPLDDSALTSGKFLDVSGNGNHITSVLTSPSFRSRTPPGAYSGANKALDGIGAGSTADYLSYGPSSTQAPPFTIEAWVYRTSIAPSNDGGYVFSSRTPEYGTSGAIQSAAETGHSEGSRGEIGNTVASSWYELNFGGHSSAGAAALNTWHHVAWVLDTTSWHMYLDGVQIGSASSISYPNAHLYDSSRPLWLSRVQAGADGFRFNGSMWYVAIYPSALSATRISARYNEVQPPHVVSNAVARVNMGYMSNGFGLLPAKAGGYGVKSSGDFSGTLRTFPGLTVPTGGGGGNTRPTSGQLWPRNHK